MWNSIQRHRKNGPGKCRGPMRCFKTEKLFRLLENTKSSRVNIRSLGGISPAVEKCGDVCQKKKQG